MTDLDSNSINFGEKITQSIQGEKILPFAGVYDVFSASIAAKYYDGIFISGFGFAASYYGLPDVGFNTWSDVIDFVQRVRTILPAHHILVDIDDGYGDPEIACHVVALLEKVGASGVIIEDQKRPRKCGHLDGKQILPLEDFLVKLEKVLAARQSLFVIARTDVTDIDEIIERAKAFERVGADAVLADGISDLKTLELLSEQIRVPLAFNQIAGGKSPKISLTELAKLGVSLVNYSTPCLFAAQAALNDALLALKEGDGYLDVGKVSLADCNAHLQANLLKRYQRF
ncbi:MAG: isocitrate lyase/PEP mutase family protein [Coleofasciculaceae cyanobacterium]